MSNIDIMSNMSTMLRVLAMKKQHFSSGVMNPFKNTFSTMRKEKWTVNPKLPQWKRVLGMESSKSI